jgi:hypothetical protein
MPTHPGAVCASVDEDNGSLSMSRVHRKMKRGVSWIWKVWQRETTQQEFLCERWIEMRVIYQFDQQCLT